MNQYHIYEEIGRGKHSVIYKGRKKKTIHYYAIKSVDKSQKPRVLQEVRTMHALDHDNVLKFFAWYETSNHLWLILEYCVGGDLRSLLRQDMRLPEASIHDFARDLVISLQYLHAAAIIYCDLKPSNVLLDENGRIKLGGFGLSRRLADINRTSLQQLPPAKRGTPCYMAPELFQDGSSHSSASDLWALGCVLYECAAGQPPFVSTSFNQLVQDILGTDPAPLPGASPQFQDLVMRLLDKNPATRITWAHVCTHPFWRSPLPPRKMPPEPMLDAYLASAGLRTAAGKPSAMHCLEVGAGRPAGVDVLRLSHIARNNLEKEAEGGEYTAATTTRAPHGDVQLHDPDAELDFEEVADEGSEEEECPSPLNSSVIDDSAAATPDDKPQQPKPLVTTSQRAQPQEANMRQPDFGQPAHAEAALSTESGEARGGEARHGEGAEGGEPPAPSSIEELMWHPSDSSVKPIVANRRIERLPELRWDPSKLPFTPLTPGQVQEMLAGSANSQQQVEAFLTQIYRALGSPAPIKDKVNVLAYFEGVCCDTAAANVVVNSTLTLLLVRMLRNARAPGLRLRLASLLGLLIRHATYITDDLAATGLVEVLADGLADKNERVRRRIMACLGELLFYIATQQESSSRSAWAVSSSTIGAVARTLEPGQDEITQHYAVKVIENIGSGCGSWPTRFGSQGVVARLAAMLAEGHPNETLRAAVASALTRLLRHTPALLTHLLTTHGVQLLINGLADNNPKIQTACINMLNQALASEEHAQPVLTAFQVQDERGPMGAVMGVAEGSAGPLKGKALLCIALLLRAQPPLLLPACNSKLVSLIEKVGKEDAYLANCVSALQYQIKATLPPVLDQISAELDAQRGATSATNQGRASTTLGLLAALEPLLASPAFRPGVLSADLVAELSGFLATLASCRTGRPAVEGFKATLMGVLEAIVQASEVGDAHAPALVQYLLPALAGTLGSKRETGDVRFWALKVLWEVTARLLSPLLASPNASSETAPIAKCKGAAVLREAVEAGVEEHVLALLGGLLEEADPMPLYALKLLGALLDADARRWLPHVRDLELLPRFFEFLSLEHANNNVHNIQLCNAVIAAGALSAQELTGMAVADKVGAVLSYAHENNVELFLEPVLELAAALLDQDAGALDASEPGCGSTAALLEQLPLLLDLAAHEDAVVAVVAAQCCALLASSFPEPAAAFLLSTEGACLLETALHPEGAEGASSGVQHALLTALPLACRAAGATLPDQSQLAALHALAQDIAAEAEALPELQETAAAAAEALLDLLNHLS